MEIYISDSILCNINDKTGKKLVKHVHILANMFRNTTKHFQR